MLLQNEGKANEEPDTSTDNDGSDDAAAKKEPLDVADGLWSAFKILAPVPDVHEDLVPQDIGEGGSRRVHGVAEAEYSVCHDEGLVGHFLLLSRLCLRVREVCECC